MKKESRNSLMVWMLLVAILAAATAWGCYRLNQEYGSDEYRGAAVRPVVANSPLDGGVSQVKSYLKKNLKDPKSLDVIEWSRVESTDYGYRVRCKYRAKNSLGGYVVNNQLFTLDKKGSVILASNYE